MTKPKPPRGVYEVGYKKPPTATQFKKGVSGNPKGRPRGSTNLQTLVRRVFDRKVTIQQDGGTRRVTVAEVMLTRLAGKAVAGDAAAQRLAIGLLQATATDVVPAPTLFESEEDRALLRSVLSELEPEIVPASGAKKRSVSRKKRASEDDDAAL